MDPLDRVVATAGPLLRRVDEVLGAAGAPDGHRVWPLLRRVRVLTADAVYAVAALRPAALAETVPELRSHARAYTEAAASLPGPGDWTGEAADAYEAVRHRLAGHLDGELVDRLHATARLADELTHWMQGCRTALATTLAEVLGSAEAVILVGTTTTTAGGTRSVPGPDVVAAAAEVAASILGTVADGRDRGAELLDGSAELTAVQRVAVDAH
jgi:hypothetical protein